MAGESPLSFGATVSLSATSSTGRVTLPTANSNQLVITNLGPDLAYINLGSATVNATTANFPLMPGSQITVTINPTIVAGAAICATTTATIKFTAADGYLAGIASANTTASAGANVTIVEPLGQAVMASSIPVVIASNQTGLNGVAYGGAKVAVTRPNDTTAYTAGDVVGGAFEVTSMGSSAGRIMLTSSQFEWDVTALPSGATTFFLALYSVTPPSALADNTAWDLPSGDRASFLGIVQLGTPVDLGSTLYVEQNIINKQIKLAGTSLFAYCVTVGGYTPSAQAVQQFTLHSVGLGL